MAPFGDGGGGGGEEEKREGDAGWGWDPMRSGSAPPTMEGAAAAAASAVAQQEVEGVYGGGGGGGGGSFFSGMDGFGARLDEVGRRRGAAAQVSGSWLPAFLFFFLSCARGVDWMAVRGMCTKRGFLFLEFVLLIVCPDRCKLWGWVVPIFIDLSFLRFLDELCWHGLFGLGLLGVSSV